MQVASIMDSSTVGATSSFQKTNATSSFANSFLQATSDSENGLDEFMQYAKETPAQRMFDSWLGGQNISMKQFQAMSPDAQQKLVQEFDLQLKEKLQSEMGTSGAAAAPSISVPE